MAGDSEEETQINAPDSAARQHYVTVEFVLIPCNGLLLTFRKSKLRQGKDILLDPKYRGAKSSREELFEDGFSMDGDENEDNQLEDDQDEVEDSVQEDDNISALEEDAESEQEQQDFEQELKEESEPSDDLSSDELDNATYPKQDDPVPTAATPLDINTNSSQGLKADIKKGQDVKKQLAFWDNLLDLRIRMQKVLTNANSLPPPEAAAEFVTPKTEEQIARIQERLNQVADDMFTLRIRLMETNDSVQIDRDTISTRKRKRSPASLYQDIHTLDNKYKPHLDATLSKWSNKVQLANGIPLNKKFKAVNQDVHQQIQQAMSDKDRLLQRTRLVRGDYELIGRPKLKDADGNIRPSVADAHLKNYDAHVLDDTDFYQHLLRELIESRMVDTNDADAQGLRWAAVKQAQKKKKNIVDTKASKGRKLRYHVQEKIQNFMVPIPTGSWHEEQVDELFGSLFGRQYRAANKSAADELNEEGDAPDAEIAPAKDGLRIFG